MKFLVLFEDNLATGADVRRTYMPEHLAFLERNAPQIQAAGPLQEADDPAAGGAWLVDANDLSEVDALVRDNPFWPTGPSTVSAHPAVEPGLCRWSKGISSLAAANGHRTEVSDPSSQGTADVVAAASEGVLLIRRSAAAVAAQHPERVPHGQHAALPSGSGIPSPAGRWRASSRTGLWLTHTEPGRCQTTSSLSALQRC